MFQPLKRHRWCKHWPPPVLPIALFVLIVFVAPLAPHDANAQGTFFDEDLGPVTEIEDDIVFNLKEPWNGDLAGIRERGVIRVLVAYSKTNFFIVNGRALGFEHDLMSQFDRFINAGRKKERHTTLNFIPLAFNELLPALEKGYGDIAVAGITITKARSDKVAFTDPYITNVDEILITHASHPDVTRWDELAGAEVRVLGASSYVEHLAEVNADLERRGVQPMRVVEAESSLQSEDLMEMVNARLIPYTVVDSHKAKLWARVLPNIKLQENVHARAGRDIAWAVRKDAPELLATLNEFIAKDLSGKKKKAASLFRTYYENTKWVKNPDLVTYSPRVHRLIPSFRKHADRYKFRWLLMMAQGYQESSLNSQAKSHVGAIGVMQVLPTTGRDMGFRDVWPPDPNIEAGIKYMRWIVKNYFDDPELPPSERVYFALAAYNAGPNRVARLRKKAPELGLDPNRWFGNMEIVVQAHVSREPVRYVANINKYYLQYSRMRELLVEHGKAPISILEVQQLLEAKGYDVGGADGVMGRKTRKAIKAYQRNHDLPETGEPSRELLSHLRDAEGA